MSIGAVLGGAWQLAYWLEPPDYHVRKISVSMRAVPISKSIFSDKSPRKSRAMARIEVDFRFKL
jgi:hypothetical protein